MSIKIFCDRCGKEVFANGVLRHIRGLKYDACTIDDPIIREGFDLCDDCDTVVQDKLNNILEMESK